MVPVNPPLTCKVEGNPKQPHAPATPLADDTAEDTREDDDTTEDDDGRELLLELLELEGEHGVQAMHGVEP